MPYDFSKEDANAVQGTPSTLGGAPEPVVEDSWITREGVKVPDLVQPVVRGVRQLVHGASFGVDKKLMALADSLVSGKSYEAEEAKHLGNLKEDREALGMAGTGLEIAGGIMSPVNRLLSLGELGKVAAPAVRNPHTLTTMAKEAVHGAGLGMGTGAAFGTLSNFGETANKDLTAEGLGNAAQTGALWGGATGLAGGALKGWLTARKPELEMKAIASTKADAEYPGKAAFKGRKGRIQELDKVARIANEQDVTGGLFQTPAVTLDKASKKASQAGQLGDQIREQLYNANGGKPVDMARNTVKTIMTDLYADVLQDRKMTPEIMDSLRDSAKWLRSMFKVPKNPNKDTAVNLADVYDAYRSVKDSLRGVHGDRTLSQTVPNQIRMKLQGKLMNTFREHAHKLDPDLTANLRIQDMQYHSMKTLEDMAASGKMGELGARNFMGRILGLGASMLPVGPLGKIGAAAGVNKLTQRGVLPNTGLWLLKQDEKLLSPLERAMAQQVGKPDEGY